MVRVTISTSISHELHKLAQDNDLSWSEMLEFGIAFKMAEMSEGFDYEYPKNELIDKIRNLALQRNDLIRQLEETKSNTPQKDPAQEFDDTLKEMGIQ